MTFNSVEIIQEIRDEFEELIDFVMIDAQKTTANQVERHLFRQLLRLGLMLLKAFFQIRCQSDLREPLVEAQGVEIPYHGQRERTYFSIFGKLKIKRSYYFSPKEGGRTPVDEVLGLGQESYSDLLREMHEQLAVYVPYEKAIDIMHTFLEMSLSKRGVQAMVTEDAAEVSGYYEQKAPPAIEQEGEILVIQSDGKGVPLVLATAAVEKVRLGKGEKRSRKKEAIVTTVYTIAAKPRTAEEVVNSLFRTKQTPSEPIIARNRPQNKQVWATLQGKDEALDRLQRQVVKREGDHICHRVALCDGAEALQSRLIARFDRFTLILDFIHANEYLWQVATCLFGEGTASRTAWVKKQTLLMLTGETQSLISRFRQQVEAGHLTPAQQTVLTKTANYFERNLSFMDYPAYLKNGWPIASGVIEGACRHLVKDRMELSGMRWQQPSAEALLSLRAVAENGDWDDYHLFHRQQRQMRLYGHPLPATALLEYHQLPGVG